MKRGTRTSTFVALGALLVVPLGAASSCSADAETSNFADTGTGGATTTGGGGGATTTTGAGGFNVGGQNAGGGTGGSITCTPGGDDDDVDLDGFTPAQGDCDDCDPNQNPNAVEVVTKDGEEPFDEDCDGQVDEVDPPCDTGLAIDESDPLVAIQAVELCKVSSGPDDWGVVSAKWAMADGSAPPATPNFDLGHGLLDGFGPNVTMQRGERMLGLSSGSARQPTDPGYQDVGGFDKGYIGTPPMGFPKESPACPGSITGEPHDVAGLEVTIRVPSNAHGFSFDFDFYTYEWPGYVCSTFNDFFVALLSPIPPNQLDGNISFDSQGNPVSVNNAFLEVCGCLGNPPAPCLAGGKSFTCPLGDTSLIGTGFGFDTAFQDHGSTEWLQTKAPVDPGTEMTLRWAVYDSGDGILDTTTLVDNFQWIAQAGVKVGTDPVPK